MVIMLNEFQGIFILNKSKWWLNLKKKIGTECSLDLYPIECLKYNNTVGFQSFIKIYAKYEAGRFIIVFLNLRAYIVNNSQKKRAEG